LEDETMNEVNDKGRLFVSSSSLFLFIAGLSVPCIIVVVILGLNPSAEVSHVAFLLALGFGFVAEVLAYILGFIGQRHVSGMGSAPSNGRLQFGLRTLLLLVVAVAVAMSVVVASPDGLAAPALMCLAVIVPAILTLLLIYGRPYQRTFCIAALFPTGVVLFATLWLITITLFDPPRRNLGDFAAWMHFFDEVSSPYRVYSAAGWLLGLGLGCVAVCIRWRMDVNTARVREEGADKLQQALPNREMEH
jgi:hypothetical protein